MTRAQAILLGLVVFAIGGAGYWVFRSSGLEGFSPGIAASALLMLVVLGWTASYLLRVVGGKMTYMEHRRRYRAAYDAVTDDDHQRTSRDLTWVRLDGWREMIASFFDAPHAIRDLAQVESLSVVGGGGATPAGVTASGAYVAGWLASRLGWTPSEHPRVWTRRPD